MSVGLKANVDGTSGTVQVNGNDVVTVNSSGNVGVGTSSPANKLEVSGSVTTTFAPNVYNTTLTGTSAATSGSAGTGISFRGYTTGSTTIADLAFISGIKENTTDANYAGALVFGTRPNGSGGGNFERMRIDSSGNVGIGTTSPNSKLDVVGDVIIGAALTTGTGASTGDVRVELGANRTGDGPCYIDWHSTAGTDFESRIIRYGGANGEMDIINMGTGGMVISQEGAAPLVFKTTATERMRIDSTGRVGIGTSNPGSELEVADNGNNNDARITIRPNSTTTSQFGASSTITLIDSSGTRSIVFYTNGTDRFIIDGTTGLLNSLPTYNSSAIGSTVVVTSTGAIRRTSSSIKYKKDVENLDPALVTNAVNNLRPVYYRTKNAEGDDKASWSHIGLIAEEVHEVEPRLVRYRTAEVLTDKEGNRVERELEVPEPEDVDYARLSVILLAKVKELETRIAVLEAK